MGEREIRLGRMDDQKLCDAAMKGDLQPLRQLRDEKDNYILDKVLVGCFKGKNPLHLAILTRQAKFVQELLEIEPKLAEVVDSELGAALHIASVTIVDALVKESPAMCMIVDALLKASPSMCMARDKDGNNPLHIAAMKGNVYLLEKLLQTCPLAAQVILDRGDTILHLCVNYNQLGSLFILLEKNIVDEFLNSKDANGNTILHIAVARNRPEMVGYLLASQKKRPLLGSGNKIDLNARNGAGYTAMDINSLVNGEAEDRIRKYRIREVLRNNGAKRSRKRWVTPPSPDVKGLLETIMVVTSLFATMAFQVGVNPPGGVWQEDSEEHRVGEAILASKHEEQYRWFMYMNTIAFFLCLSAILVLLILSVPMPEKRVGWILPVMSLLAIFTTAYTYTYSVIVVSPKQLMAGVTYYSFCAGMAGFLMVIVVLLLATCVERRTPTTNSPSTGQVAST